MPVVEHICEPSVCVSVDPAVAGVQPGGTLTPRSPRGRVQTCDAPQYILNLY